MPAPWMPGLIKDPGTGAGYNAGRNSMQFVVLHDTGGTNSYQICKDGRPGYNSSLCQILVPKQGTPWQFTEIDAECYHIGSSSDYDHDGQPDDFNTWAPGIEVERLQGDPLTDSQIGWLGKIVAWLHDEWGVPVVHFAGPFGAVEQFRGFVNHRDIHPNPDGLSPEEWDRVVATIAAPPAAVVPLEDELMNITHIACPDGPNKGIWAFFEIAGKPAYRRLSTSVNAVTGNARAVIYEPVTFGGFLAALQKQGAIDCNG